MISVLTVYTSKEKNHEAYIKVLESALKQEGTLEKIDMNTSQPLHEIFYKIRDCKPDLVITFDCAGFELRSETDSTSLNLLSCRVVHLLFKNPNEYGTYLKEELNLNHFVYLKDEFLNLTFKEEHNNLPYINSLPSMDENNIKEWFSKERIEMEI